MKKALDILNYIETDYFWKEQTQFLAIIVDYTIKGIQNVWFGFIS